MSTKQYKDLEDINHRFQVSATGIDSVQGLELSARAYIDQHEVNEYKMRLAGFLGGSGRAHEDAGAGGLLRDTISNKEFIAIPYTDIPRTLPEGAQLTDDDMQPSIMLGEVKNGEIVGTPASAAKAMGLSKGIDIDAEGLYDGSLVLKEQIRIGISDQQRPNDKHI